MIQHQIKLQMTQTQRHHKELWLPILGSIFNFGIRKIQLNAANKIYFTPKEFHNLLAGHSKTLEIPSHVIQGVLSTAHQAWDRCFKKLAGKPKLKGVRRPMSSIPFPDPIKITGNRVALPGMGKVKFHKQELPVGKIKCGRLITRASGNYLCLFIDAAPKAIERTASGAVGIDPGFKDLVTLSTGEKLGHPREFLQIEKRLAQAQRGKRRRQAARLHERAKNRRKDRNHKLSRRLVAENTTICFLKDNHQAVAKRFGKSVGDSAHGGLRTQLAYKSLIGGSKLIFPENRNSTRTCSTCKALTGPAGLAGLKVREWSCSVCGALHDRDVHSARNALYLGAGSALQ